MIDWNLMRLEMKILSTMVGDYSDGLISMLYNLYLFGWQDSE